MIPRYSTMLIIICIFWHQIREIIINSSEWEIETKDSRIPHTRSSFSSGEAAIAESLKPKKRPSARCLPPEHLLIGTDNAMKQTNKNPNFLISIVSWNDLPPTIYPFHLTYISISTSKSAQSWKNKLIVTTLENPSCEKPKNSCTVPENHRKFPKKSVKNSIF